MICKSLRLRVVSVLLFSACLVGCTSQPDAPPAPSPSELLQAIAPADSTKYERVRDMKNWRNPYLIVHSDGVVLFDAANSAEIILKPDELLAALSRLPASNWPYGRVVAATENSVRASEQDGIDIRRTRGIVGGILEGANITVKWVPSA